MIPTDVSPRRLRLGLAVIVGLGLSVLSLPAFAGVGEREPGVSLRGAEAAPQLQFGDEVAVPAAEADAPLVVADNQAFKNTRTGTRITQTNIGTTRISFMCGLGGRDPITGSSSAASFSARS